jgi:hypothetical protein
VSRRTALLAAVVAVSAAACGIPADSAPHDIPEDRQVVYSPSSGGTDATGPGRIYLVEPGDDQLLRSVPREESSAEDLIEILLRGANPDELNADYSSAIPSSLELLSVREQGTSLVLDVSEELKELSGPGLVKALAQIVYTATELDGIDSVQITVLGDRISWPKANLESTSDPLRTYDYPGLVRSAQPAYPSTPSRG